MLTSLENQIKSLDDARESLANTLLLISDNNEELYKNVSSSFSHLDNVSLDRKKVYEAIDLNSQNPAQYTTQDVLNACLAKAETYQPNSDQMKQLRQVQFTLGNEVGKIIYDAWLLDLNKGLSADGSLSMLRISTEDVENFGIDFAPLSEKLIILKNGCDELKKDLNSFVDKKV